MIVVWKYKIRIHGKFSLSIPDPGRIVHFGEDRDADLCAWAEINPANSVIGRREVPFCVLPTGGEVPTNATHVGSTVDHNKEVWHLYMMDQGG